MTQERKPDWEWWGKVDEVTVIEAVALSMDIDPNKLHYRKPPGTMGVVEVRDESPEFEKRFSLAIRNLKVLEAWGIGGAVRKLEYCLVKLVKFAAVALSWNWKVPTEMAARAEPYKRDIEILDLRRQVGTLTQERDKLHAQVDDLTVKLQAADSPLGERSKKSYLNIIAVLLEYISGTFPTVGKHPSFKNEAQLIALIDSKFKGIPGLSERNLQGKFPEAKQSLDKT